MKQTYFLILTFLFSFSVASAQFNNPIGASSIFEFMTQVIDLIIRIGVPVLVLSFAYTGYLFVSARGQMEALKRAKSMLVWSSVGAVIILGALVILLLVRATIIDEVGVPGDALGTTEQTTPHV